MSYTLIKQLGLKVEVSAYIEPANVVRADDLATILAAGVQDANALTLALGPADSKDALIADIASGSIKDLQEAIERAEKTMKDLKEHLDRIEAKVDKLDERLDKVDVHMAKYNSELEFHVSRVTQVEDELLPIARHVEQLRGAFKLASWLFGTALAIFLAWLGLKHG